ncbi:MAG TPA: hypothetical protein PKZ77_07215 [Pseudomonadales bacterium]|nr:hypothetical protein [Pseudomonadales bacterium]HNC70258.1 hypothetical protein [Pseudomonadales bacterium]HND14653.1 hypothetical protein [Pseudomonadales bacterium]
MNTTSVSQAGWNGIREGMGRAQDAGARIAAGSVSREPAGLVEAMVDLSVAELQVAASARVVEAGNSLIGALLDVHA